MVLPVQCVYRQRPRPTVLVSWYLRVPGVVLVDDLLGQPVSLLGQGGDR
jgi:hypothetical protein